jgi:hypothetical protein
MVDLAAFRLWAARLICPMSHRVAPYDPSAPMIRAACRSMSPGRRPTEEWVPNSVKHGIRYRAMLDAASDTGS